MQNLNEIKNFQGMGDDIMECNIMECNRKLEDLKCAVCELQSSYSIKSIESINEELEELEDRVDAIRHELPEIRLTKQIVLGLVAIILTSFVGFAWDKIFSNFSGKFDNPVKKLIEEYNGGKK